VFSAGLAVVVVPNRPPDRVEGAVITLVQRRVKVTNKCLPGAVVLSGGLGVVDGKRLPVAGVVP
jgi:hypothetical protein